MIGPLVRNKPMMASVGGSREGGNTLLKHTSKKWEENYLAKVIPTPVLETKTVISMMDTYLYKDNSPPGPSERDRGRNGKTARYPVQKTTASMSSSTVPSSNTSPEAVKPHRLVFITSPPCRIRPGRSSFINTPPSKILWEINHKYGCTWWPPPLSNGKYILLRHVPPKALHTCYLFLGISP